MKLVTAAKRFTYLVHLSFQKREWRPLSTVMISLSTWLTKIAFISTIVYAGLVTYEILLYLPLVIMKRCSASNGHSECMYRWFSRYVIAAMLVDGKQKIAHQLALSVHQHLFISLLLFVSPEIAWKPPNISHVLWNPEKLPASDSNI